MSSRSSTLEVAGGQRTQVSLSSFSKILTGKRTHTMGVPNGHQRIILTSGPDSTNDSKEQGFLLNYVSTCALGYIPGGSPHTLPASWSTPGWTHTPSYFSKRAPVLTQVCILTGVRSRGEPMDSLTHPGGRRPREMRWNIFCFGRTVTTRNDVDQGLMGSERT